MKVYESKTLISAMENRSYEYKSLREKLINLQNAFQGMADLGDDFQGKGADNIKAFYKEHARNIDEWLAMIDMQTAFFDSISVALEEADLADNTFVDVSFLENELEIAYQKSNVIVAEQKQALKVILNDIKDIVPLEVFSTADFKQHISDSKVEKDNTIDKINEVDSKLRKEYKKSELNQDYIEARSKALIDATGKGKNAQPINFNATAYYDTKVFKYRDEIHKKTQEYLTIKKDEAEKIAAEKERQRIEAFKKKLETTIDNAEYIKIADEIGYDNLTTDQKVIYNLAKFNKTGDDILNGIGTGLKDVVMDTATGIWDTVTNPMETLEGIGNVLIHPVDTFNIVKQGIEKSFERDVINGDAESRARWFSYAVGMVGTSVFGTKGVDKVGKAAKAGKLGQTTTKATKVPKRVASKAIMVSKEALEKSVASFKKSAQRVIPKIKGIQIHNPFAPQVEFAGIGKVPYNVLNGEKIKEKFIQFAKKVSDISKKPFTGKNVSLPWLNKDRYGATEVKGHAKVKGKTKDVSRRVYTWNDIDLNQKNEFGVTNLELMKKGSAPYAKDGTQINLHHLIQEEKGTMIEIPNSWHRKYYKIIHGLKGKGESFRNDPELKAQYNYFRSRYWKWRADEIEKQMR